MSIKVSIDVNDVLDFLDDLIEEAENNLATYEEFDGEIFQLADFRKMQPFDSFLYGVANGKKDQLDFLKAFIEDKIEELENEH